MFRSKPFFLLLFIFISCDEVSKKQLPIYNPTDFNPKLVDKSIRNVSDNHRVKDFNLINQNGIKVSSKDYENKIYVVDFFFTTCPSICPIMTNNMLLIQEEFIQNNDIMLLSMSVTPEIDNVEVLKKCHRSFYSKGLFLWHSRPKSILRFAYPTVVKPTFLK